MTEIDMQWRFEVKTPTEPNSNSGVYEHFTDGEVEALVREVIQNSIDANVSGGVTKVHFTFGKAKNDFRDKHFAGKLLSHLNMKKSLRDGDFTTFQKMKDRFDDGKWDNELDYLLVEDFGTSGLSGNHNAMSSTEYDSKGNPLEVNNRFQKFHWDWGGNDDEHGEGSGGAWGYGKAALTLASKIKTIMSLSTRNVIEDDDTTLEQTLFGLSLISPHADISAKPKPIDYRMYGYYCINPEKDILPHSSNLHGMTYLEDFKKEVNITRKCSIDERGLSVLIPWPKKVFTPESILCSVINNYSYALQNGLLEVKITASSGKSSTIQKTNVLTFIKEDKFGWEKDEQSSLLDLNELLNCAETPLKLTIPDKAKHNITPILDALTDDQKKEWSEYFNDPSSKGMKNVRVTLPLEIDETGKIEHGTFQTTFKNKLESSRTFFQRHVIRVMEPERNQNYKQPNTIALTEIKNDKNNALHKFLRKAEPPSHMKWEVNGNKKTRKWTTPRNILDFVQRFVPKFISYFKTSASGDPVATGWATFSSKGNQKKKAFPKIPKVPSSLKKSKWPLDMTKIVNGMKFTKPTGSTKITKGTKIKIEAALSYSKGDDFSNWEKSDFEMANLTVEVNGVTETAPGIPELTFSDNHVIFEVDKPGELEIKISGFNKDMEWNGRSKIV